MRIILSLVEAKSSGVFSICLLLSIMLIDPALAQVNKCKINGKIVYTNQACPEKISTPGEKTDGYRSASWYRDHRGYTAALKIRSQQKVPIFIYAYTDWCVYCKKLHARLLSDSKVKKALAGYVKVKINPEHSPADLKLFQRWGGRGYPTLYIQSKSGSRPTRVPGPFTRHNGSWKLVSKSSFIAMLKKLENPVFTRSGD